MKKSKFVLQFGAMLLAFTIFMPSISWAIDNNTGQVKIFVYVEGIEGSSTDYNHAGWIDAIGFSGGITMPVPNDPAKSGQRASGYAEFTPISIVKGLDLATVGLYVKAATGRPIANVIIEVVVNDLLLFKYTLTEVIISKVGSDMERDKVIGAVEIVEFDYVTVRWEYTDNRGGTVQYGWDRESNQQS